MKKISIKIVVLNYFSSKKVIDCLLSIEGQLFSDDVVIIGDNSNDLIESKKLSNFSSQYDNIHYVSNESNLGFSAGCNAVARSFGEKDFLLLLNPDTIVREDFLDSFRHRISNSDSLIRCLSPNGFWLGTSKVWSAGGKFHWLRGRADVRTDLQGFQITDFGTCACLFIEENLFWSVGGLNEDYFLGGEEWQLSLDIRRLNVNIWFDPDIVYWHEVSGTHEKYGIYYYGLGMTTKLKFVDLNYGVLKYIFFVGYVLIGFSTAIRYWLRHRVVFSKLIKMHYKVAYWVLVSKRAFDLEYVQLIKAHS